MRRSNRANERDGSIITGQRVTEGKAIRAWEMRRSMTPEEQLLWDHLRASRLQGFHFRRQQVIDGFIADFYCHAARLVVEVDGAGHGDQIEYDAERDRILAARGLRILRVTNDEVRSDLDGVLASIVANARSVTIDGAADGAPA